MISTWQGIPTGFPVLTALVVPRTLAAIGESIATRRSIGRLCGRVSIHDNPLHTHQTYIAISCLTKLSSRAIGRVPRAIQRKVKVGLGAGSDSGTKYGGPERRECHLVCETV